MHNLQTHSTKQLPSERITSTQHDRLKALHTMQETREKPGSIFASPALFPSSSAPALRVGATRHQGFASTTFPSRCTAPQAALSHPHALVAREYAFSEPCPSTAKVSDQESPQALRPQAHGGTDKRRLSESTTVAAAPSKAARHCIYRH
eukprot:6210969-Pleurochrysis_carterae.AAC.2